MNLCIVALFGFLLRSKILFPIAFLDYRNLLSAHSHFAFSGWVGLSLFTLLIYNLLPADVAGKRFYQWILAGIELSSLGIALSAPFVGYTGVAVVFSLLYILIGYVVAPVFIRDVRLHVKEKPVRLLAIAAVVALLLSALGTFGLLYIIMANSTNAIFYRDSTYAFLHFQYNGFFTLAVLALFFQLLYNRKVPLTGKATRFAVFLCLSVLPALFLSLLWHGSTFFYSMAAVGALLIVLALVQFLPILVQVYKQRIFSSRMANTFLLFSLLSFVLKMLLNVGTLVPALGNAVYGDRPVIIGFLHLVFLGFVTFFLLAWLVGQQYFCEAKKGVWLALVVFALGIFTNEVFLALQGLGILFKTNSYLYNWYLWAGSILLFVGACGLAWVYWQTKKAAAALP